MFLSRSIALGSQYTFFGRGSFVVLFFFCENKINIQQFLHLSVHFISQKKIIYLKKIVFDAVERIEIYRTEKEK